MIVIVSLIIVSFVSFELFPILPIDLSSPIQNKEKRMCNRHQNIWCHPKKWMYDTNLSHSCFSTFSHTGQGVLKL